MFPRQPLQATARLATLGGGRVARRGRTPPPPARPSLGQTQTQTQTQTPGAGPSTSSASASSADLGGVEGGGRRVESVGGWYHVGRSEGGELPVYSKFRNGGNCTTTLRKVEGDAKTLQAELNEYFQQSHIDPFTHAPKVTLRPTNGHLQVKGHWVQEVKGWLEGKGF